MITKPEIAIRFLQEHEPFEGYAGMFSGGKDSSVLMDLGVKSGCNITWFYSLMPDPPELIKFVRSYPNIHVLHPPYSFWAGILKNFPPHRKAAWCCRVLKEGPSIKLPYTHRLLGIRAEESRNRAKQGMVNKITRKRINYHPLYDWKEWEIWEYIEQNKVRYCSLYDDGFARLGCVVCPKRTNTKSQELFRRCWPQYFRLFEKQVKKWWKVKGQFRETELAKNADEFIQNWYNGK